MQGDMGRCGETWGNMGRCGETQGDAGRCRETETERMGNRNQGRKTQRHKQNAKPSLSLPLPPTSPHALHSDSPGTHGHLCVWPCGPRGAHTTQ